jgi:hypothetical protein
MPQEDKSLRRYLERRKGQMKNERSSFDTHYKELSEYVQPRRGRFFTGDRNKGTKVHNSIINSKATQALRVARAGLLAGTMSPTRPWFVLETTDPELMEVKDVRVWLAKQEKLLRAIMNQSNLYNMAPVMLGELLLFGTGAMLHVNDFEDVARFYTLTAGSYMIGQNDRQEVDTLCREFEMTTSQIVGKFGLDNVSSQVKNAYDRGNYDSWQPVCHMIEPNPESRAQAFEAKDLAWRSIYWEPGNNVENSLLSTSGFTRFPAYVPRWDVTGEDVYGTDCPGMTALGDIKGLQIEEKRKAQGIDKMVNPPLHGPAALRNVPVSSLPGGLTVYDGAQNAQGLRPIYMVQPQLGELNLDIQRVEKRIDDAFFVDMFLAISNMEGIQPRNQLDLMQRQEERLLQLGPVLERVHGEFLEQLIDRLFDQGMDAEIIRNAPPELEEADIEVRFVSSLAQAQRSVVTGTIERVFQFAGSLAEMKPEILDKLNVDAAMDEYSEAVGLPPNILESEDEVAAVREERQQQIQQAQQMEMAQQMATTAKTASDIDATDDSAISKLTEAAGGQIPEDE